MPLMPRAYRGSPFASDSFNTVAREVELQGLACKARRSSPAAAQSANVDRVVIFQVEDYDTLGGGMWSSTAPTYLIVREPGTYFLDAQIRWQYPTTGSPYNTGQRAGKIMVNTTDVTSTDPVAGPKKSDKKAWAVDGEGVTLSMATVVPLQMGDRIYLNFWHSASGPLDCLHQDFGGTYLAATRQSGLT